MSESIPQAPPNPIKEGENEKQDNVDDSQLLEALVN
jgi:hypothetical protein